MATPDAQIDPQILNYILTELTTLASLVKAQQKSVLHWLPGITGIIGTISGFIIGARSLNITKKQITSNIEISKIQNQTSKEISAFQTKAELITKSRREWIEKLRSEIAHLFALTKEGYNNEGINQDKDQEIWKSHIYIELMLNPNEDQHKDFINKQLDLISFCAQGEKNTSEWVKTGKIYIAAAQAILKSEWKRVKEFE